MSIGDTRIEHINFILDKLNEKRINNQNCDCTIKHGSHMYKCHKIILQISSSVFEKLIENNENSNQNTIEIDSIVKNNSEHFPSFLSYLYTGKISITNDNICDLFLLADAFKIDRIVQFCCDTITEFLTFDNVFDIYQIAKDLNQNSLLDICYSFFGLEFYNLDIDFLFERISNEGLWILLNDNRLVLWNLELNYFFVGWNYVEELCKIVTKLVANNSNFDQENSFNKLLENIDKSIRKSKIELNNFISSKYFSVPQINTCPIDRYFPFGMHPLQFKNMPYRTSLCSQTVLNTIQDCNPKEWKIQIITFYIIPKWNNICQIIAGIDVTYQKIWNENERKKNKCHISQSEKYKKKEMKLSPSENIIIIEIHHSWTVNSLSFETDQGNFFGPFGDPNPPQCPVQTTRIDVRTHKSGMLYLHGFYYIDIMSCGFQLCNQISFECATFDINKLEDQFKNISNLITKKLNSKISKDFSENERHHSNVNILNMRPLGFFGMGREI